MSSLGPERLPHFPHVEYQRHEQIVLDAAGGPMAPREPCVSTPAARQYIAEHKAVHDMGNTLTLLCESLLVFRASPSGTS